MWFKLHARQAIAASDVGLVLGLIMEIYMQILIGKKAKKERRKESFFFKNRWN